MKTQELYLKIQNANHAEDIGFITNKEMNEIIEKAEDEFIKYESNKISPLCLVANK